MIIQKLISFLGAELGIYVGVDAPEQLTDYVLIDQTGSETENHITTTTLAIQSYGGTLYEAMTLNEEVKAAMLIFLEDPDVAGVYLETDYSQTDTSTKQRRWQAVYHITHYLGGF